MTDRSIDSVWGEWVPRVGLLERLPAERTDLIRGLLQLAALRCRQWSQASTPV